ncbi:MAG: heparinase II/III family protein [Spirochaetes bacterium]|nr:heparinase II/III family protein [Spirochaetota bacterium]
MKPLFPIVLVLGLAAAGTPIDATQWQVENRSPAEGRFSADGGALKLERKTEGYKLRIFRDLAVRPQTGYQLSLSVKVEGPGEAQVWVYRGKEDGSWDEKNIPRSPSLKEGAHPAVRVAVPCADGGISRLRLSLFVSGKDTRATFTDLSLEDGLPQSPPPAPAKAERGAAIGDPELFAELNLEFPGMDGVKAAAARGDFEKAAAAYLDFRRTKSRVKWQVNPADKPARASQKANAGADRILQHYYTPWGPESEGFIGEDIDWNSNPVPKTSPLFNIEWTARLNRMFHWAILGAAYWQTLDEKYAREWAAQVVDWVEDNPVTPDHPNKVEPAPWNTLSAGIRMSETWMDAYFTFLNAGEFTPAVHLAFLRGVVAHARRLDWVARGYLKTKRSGGNWASAEGNGLATLSILFPELSQAGPWRSNAFAVLAKELEAQVYPDGAQIELAPGYHQMARNLFAGVARTAMRNGVALPDQYLEKTKKMYLFDVRLMDQAGNLPPFNDSGVSSALSGQREAHELWKDDAFLFGKSLGRLGAPMPTSYAFPYAGYRVMRGGWKRTDSTLTFDTGPIGFGHWHEDQLTLYLTLGGKPLLTEAGMRMYEQSPYREYALSTRAHNTITVDGKEQHRGDAIDPIQAPLAWPWLSTPFADFAQASYTNGYQATRFVSKVYYPKEFTGEKDFSVAHRRCVLFAKPYYWIVFDELGGSGRHRYDSHFHLDAPEAVYDPAAQTIRTVRPDVNLGLHLLDRDAPAVKILVGQENPVYGWAFQSTAKRPIPTVILTKEGEAPTAFAALLYPYRGPAPAVSWKDLSQKGGALVKSLSTPHEDLVACWNRGLARVSVEAAWRFACDGEIFLARRPKDGGPRIATFFNGKSYSDASLSLRGETPLSLVIAFTSNGVLFQNPTESELRFTIEGKKPLALALAPGKWAALGPNGPVPSDGVPGFVESSPTDSSPTYAVYLAQSKARPTAAAKRPIVSQAEDMIVEGSGIAITKGKVGAKTPCIYHWDLAGQKLERRFEAEEGFYRILLRYCAGDNPVRRIQVDGETPFRELGALLFPPTQKGPLSDGWSNKTDDWECVFAGSGEDPDGYLIHLTRGRHTLTLLNEAGSMNLDLVALVPQGMGLAEAVKEIDP